MPSGAFWSRQPITGVSQVTSSGRGGSGGPGKGGHWTDTTYLTPGGAVGSPGPCNLGPNTGPRALPILWVQRRRARLTGRRSVRRSRDSALTTGGFQWLILIASASSSRTSRRSSSVRRRARMPRPSSSPPRSSRTGFPPCRDPRGLVTKPRVVALADRGVAACAVTPHLFLRVG